MKTAKNLILFTVILFFINSCGSDDNPTPTDDDPNSEPSFGSLNLDGGTVADVTDIAVGRNHSVLLLSDGTVWSSGRMTGTPTFVKIYEDVISISVLHNTTALITTDGTLYTYAFASQSIDIIFTEVAQNVKSVTLGYGAWDSSAPDVAYIKADNTLWLPLNTMENLGLSTNQDAYQQVLTDVNDVDLSYESNSSIVKVLKNDNTFWETIGPWSIIGQGFTQNDLDTQYPIHEGVFYQVLANIAAFSNSQINPQNHQSITTVVATTGEVFISGRVDTERFFGIAHDVVNDVTLSTFEYKLYPNLSNIRDATNAYLTYFIIDDSDNLLATGTNAGYPHGDGSTGEKSSYQEVYQNVSKVATNGEATFILLNDGSVKTTGINSNGLLGIGIPFTNKTNFDEDTTGGGIGVDEDILGTWNLPDGSSFTFNSDSTALLKIKSLNTVCTDSNIPVEWSTNLGTITLENGAYTFCSGNSTYEESIAATPAASVPYSVVKEVSLNLNGQEWLWAN